MVSAAWTVTFIAARTAPSPSRTGTATERTPGASSSSANAQPRARTSTQLVAQLLGTAADVARQPRPARELESPGQLVGRKSRQHDLALGGLHSREPGADLHAQRDDLRHRDPCDIDDVGAVELGHRRRLTRLRDQSLEVWPRDVPQPQTADVGGAEAEHLRGQGERAVRGGDVAELLEGQQQPARGRPRQARRPSRPRSTTSCGGRCRSPPGCRGHAPGTRRSPGPIPVPPRQPPGVVSVEKSVYW